METIRFHTVVGQDQVIRPPASVQLPSGPIEVTVRPIPKPAAAEPDQHPRRRWRELRGSVPYPLCGEDAQVWISRSRHEADDQRMRQWRNSG